MIKIFTIAKNTFNEVVRQPVYLIIFICAFFLILLSPYYTMFAMLSNNKMIKDTGLATLLLTGLVISIFASTSVIYKEIENKTILGVISKPVSKYAFILAKYIGVLMAILLCQYLLTLLLTQVVRTEITEAAYSKTDYPVLYGFLFAIIFSLIMGAYANFFYQKPFPSATIFFAIPTFSFFFLILCLIDHKWGLQSFGKNIDVRILIASILICMAVSIITAVAMASSTRFSPLPNLFITSFVFLLGLFSDYIFGRFVEKYLVCKVLYAIIPNLQIYWVADAIIEDINIPLAYFKNTSIYTLIFVLIFIFIALILFEKKETG